MNLVATIERLESEGFTAEQVVTILKCIFAGQTDHNGNSPKVKPRSAAAIRQAAYRSRRDVNSSEWSAIRGAVLRRDSNRCHYCGKDANTVDHKTPLSRGGKSTLDNLVAACRACNSSKAGRDEKQWKEVYQ